MRLLNVQAVCCVMYRRSYVKPKESNLTLYQRGRIYNIFIILYLLYFIISKVINSMKYCAFSIKFLYKYFRQIRSYEQIIDNLG